MKSSIRLSILLFAAVILSVQSLFAQLPKPGAGFHFAGDSGGWTWYNEPKAVYYEGTHKRTYFGWVNQYSADGMVRVAMFDHETNQTVVTIMKTKYGADDHNHPAIIVRPDGRIMVFYTGHSSSNNMNVAISKDPEDISVFESDAPIIKSSEAICYPNAMFLSDEGEKGRFYLAFRSIYAMPCWTHSDDWGKTWSPVKQFFYSRNAPEGHRPYVKYCSNGKDEIHMIIEAWHRRYQPPVYYMKYKKGVFYKENDVVVGDTSKLPIYNEKMDTLWNAVKTGYTMTCWDIALDSAQNPVFVSSKFKSTSNDGDWTLNHLYYYFRWDGTKWFSKQLLNSGRSMGGEAGFAGGLTLDHENTNVVYLSRQYGTPAGADNFTTITDETHEIERWVTHDKGVTWDSTVITQNSAKKNTRPCVPRGHKAGGKFELMWMYGDYSSLGAGGFPDKINFYPYDEKVANNGSKAGQPAQKLHLSIDAGGIRVSIDNPAQSRLRIYDLGGRLIADYTPVVRGMDAGRHLITWGELGLGNGLFVVELYNGFQRDTKGWYRIP